MQHEKIPEKIIIYLQYHLKIKFKNSLQKYIFCTWHFIHFSVDISKSRNTKFRVDK